MNILSTTLTKPDVAIQSRFAAGSIPRYIIVFPVTIFGLGRLAVWIAYGNLNPVFPEGILVLN